MYGLHYRHGVSRISNLRKELIMARRISYSDVISQIQSNIGYRPSERNITDIKKALSRGESKTSVISRFSKKYQLNILTDLNRMTQSTNPIESKYANTLLNDQSFMKNANLALSGKVDKGKHPRFYSRYKSAKAYASHTKWKETLLEKYREHVENRISDPDIKAEIEKALNELSIFEDNIEITNAFDELAYMYKYVRTTTKTFEDFLRTIHILDEFSTQDEIEYYLSKFDINEY